MLSLLESWIYIYSLGLQNKTDSIFWYMSYEVCMWNSELYGVTYWKIKEWLICGFILKVIIYAKLIMDWSSLMAVVTV